MDKNKQFVPIKILESNGTGTGWFQVPRFWVDDLMGAHWGFPDGKRSARINNSFWKFLFYLWRWIASTKDRRTKIAIDSFPVRKDAAVRWVAAISVSGLFDVTTGVYTPMHDSPTEFRYRVNATEQEWRAFIIALDLTLNNFKQQLADFTKADERRVQRFNNGGNNGAFKVELALNVDKIRKEQFNLPPVNTAFLQDAANGKVKDQFGRPVAKWNDEHTSIHAAYYPATRRKRKGESDEDYVWRLQAEEHPAGCHCPRCVHGNHEDYVLSLRI